MALCISLFVVRFFIYFVFILCILGYCWSLYLDSTYFLVVALKALREVDDFIDSGNEFHMSGP